MSCQTTAKLISKIYSIYMGSSVFEVNELYEYGRLVNVVLGNFILTFSNILYVYNIYSTYQYLLSFLE